MSTTNAQAQRIYERWDHCARSGNLEELLSLYAPQAVFESPLVAVLTTGPTDGRCHGHEEMRAFFRVGFDRRPNAFVRWYRTGRYHFDGRTLVWEYPGETPDGEQLDLVEVMDLEEGLIVHHKVYWGFRGVGELLRSQREKLGKGAEPALADRK